MSALRILPRSSTYLAADCTTLRIVINSLYIKLSLLLQLTLSKIVRAPHIEQLSNKGAFRALVAATSARFSPEARPTPICVRPLFRITLDTSAKSTFVRGLSIVIISAIPLAADAKTLSGNDIASLNFIFAARLAIWSLSIMSSESTTCRNSSMPSNAC